MSKKCLQDLRLTQRLKVLIYATKVFPKSKINLFSYMRRKAEIWPILDSLQGIYAMLLTPRTVYTRVG